jgi:hypothetical protein
MVSIAALIVRLTLGGPGRFALDHLFGLDMATRRLTHLAG